MKRKNNTIDWSNRQNRQLLIDTRRYIWLSDTIDKIASWTGLRHGMYVVDVGCGLGYLGYTYWHFYRKGGRYIGVDINAKLLQDAKRTAKIWAKRQPFFIAGDSCNLPLQDNSADCVMCQTLFIHLKNPVNALTEIMRIVKPGGLVVCIEPDNLSWRNYDSLPELSITDRCLLYEYDLIWNKGHMKLGLGDAAIGAKILHIMKEAGLTHLDVRQNDMVYILEPPYKSPVQQFQLKMIKNYVASKKKDLKSWVEEEKKSYLAGGGSLKKFNRVMRIYNRHRLAMKSQVKRCEFFRCRSGSFYIAKGIKPK